MARREIFHHTPEQVRGYIDTAERILQGCGYDDAERVALLPSVLGLLASKNIVEDLPAPSLLTAAPFGGKLQG